MFYKIILQDHKRSKEVLEIRKLVSPILEQKKIHNCYIKLQRTFLNKQIFKYLMLFYNKYPYYIYNGYISVEI